MAVDFSTHLACLEGRWYTPMDHRTPHRHSASWRLVFLVYIRTGGLYEVTDKAYLEVEFEAHPVAAQVDGRVVKTNLELGWPVRAGQTWSS